jgi:hypothetical protein
VFSSWVLFFLPFTVAIKNEKNIKEIPFLTLIHGFGAKGKIDNRGKIID